MLKSPEESVRLRFADLEVDLHRQTVTRNGVVLPVEGRSFQLLRILVERYPQLVTHAELVSGVWGRTVVGSDALTQRIKLLRRGLSAGGNCEYVVSVHGQGYRLVEPAGRESNASDAAKPATSRRIALRWIAVATVIFLIMGALALLLSAPHALKHAIRHALM